MLIFYRSTMLLISWLRSCMPSLVRMRLILVLRFFSMVTKGWETFYWTVSVVSIWGSFFLVDFSM